MKPTNRWIDSAAYDLPLIALAPLIGFATVIAALVVGEKTLLAAHFVEANFFLLGMPHYLSTYVFYLDDENARYHATRKFAFYAGPVIVAAIVTGAMFLRLFIAVAVVVVVWNVFHVSRQSSGILSVYRHRSGGDHRYEKLPAMIGLLAANAGMFLVSVANQSSTSRIFKSIIESSRIAAPIVLMVAAVALGALFLSMARRRAGLAEWIFVASSVLLFGPYLFIRDLTLATTAMLSGHYIQYLGLLWLLNHRKYAAVAEGSGRQRAIAAVSRNAPTIVGFITLMAVMPFLADRVVHSFGWMAFHTWWLNVTVLLHFYLDGLFWAFRDPHVRRTLGPYLSRPAVAAAS